MLRILVRGEAQRWSPDFVHDQFANGRRFRLLNMVDDVTKERLGPFRRRRFPRGALPRTPILRARPEDGRHDQLGIFQTALLGRITQASTRYGYRRVHVLLRRDGRLINQKRTRRIYRELGLQLRNKTPKRRVKAKLRDDRRPATRSNETWAMDFVHDQLATRPQGEGVDDRRRILALLAGAGERHRRGVCKEVGFPATIRVDQGSEFVSRELDLWAYQRGVTLDFPARQAD